MKTLGLTKNDSWQIGFVCSAVFYNGIELNEASLWCEKIVRENILENVPDYIFEILNSPSDVFKSKSEWCIIILKNFAPSFPFKKSTKNALTGIGYKRGLDVYWEEGRPSKQKCLQTLEKHPEVEEMFREVFPFIELPW